MDISKQEEFLQQWEAKTANKSKNNTALSLKRYQEIIEILKIAKVKTSKETDKEYHLMKRYEILSVRGKEFLINKNKDESNKDIFYHVPNEQLYEKIHEIHLMRGHGGIRKMMKHMKEKYYNITEDAVKLYIEGCQECQRRRIKTTSKTAISNPIRSHNFNHRCQVDLIDMRSEADGEFKWILNYQDHFTKFVHLRPLKYKTAEEVAYHIVDIFQTSNGAPLILQTDNGGEFVNDWLKEIAKQWPGMKLVRGRSRYPQSQGSVEAANKEIKKMLGSWASETNSTNWATKGLSMVQFWKNTSYHQTLKMSPCEALYGKKAYQGLWSTGLEPSTFDKFVTEDDLLHYYESQDIEDIPIHNEQQQPSEIEPVEITQIHNEQHQPTDMEPEKIIRIQNEQHQPSEINPVEIIPMVDDEQLTSVCQSMVSEEQHHAGCQATFTEEHLPIES